MRKIKVAVTVYINKEIYQTVHINYWYYKRGKIWKPINEVKNLLDQFYKWEVTKEGNTLVSSMKEREENRNQYKP